VLRFILATEWLTIIWSDTWFAPFIKSASPSDPDFVWDIHGTESCGQSPQPKYLPKFRSIAGKGTD
jgi:hypothetical protein